MQIPNYRFDYYRFRNYYQHVNQTLSTKQSKAYIMAILSLFTMSFFGFFAVRPTVKTIIALQRQIDDNRKLDKSLSEKITTLVKAQSEYEVLKGGVYALEGLIPNGVELAGIIQELETIEKDSGASISALALSNINVSEKNTQESKQKTDINKVSFVLAVNGSYNDIYSFINKLLISGRFFTIENIDFAPSLSGDKQIIRLNLKLDTYYL